MAADHHEGQPAEGMSVWHLPTLQNKVHLILRNSGIARERLGVWGGAWNIGSRRRMGDVGEKVKG